MVLKVVKSRYLQYLQNTVLLIIILLCGNYYFNVLKNDNITKREKAENALDEWKSCMEQKIAQRSEDVDEIWNKNWRAIEICENITFINELNIMKLKNSDRAKYHVVPKTLESSTLVTIGIGYDIEAEEILKKKLIAPIAFYGADPVVDGNKEVYNTIGNFFPLAIGAKSGVKEASVLIKEKGYSRKRVPHVDIIYFLKSLVKKTFYDSLWLNNEGAEYDILPLLFKGSKLDEAGITICQLNIEFHVPRIEKKLPFVHKFLKNLLDDGRSKNIVWINDIFYFDKINWNINHEIFIYKSVPISTFIVLFCIDNPCEVG